MRTGKETKGVAFKVILYGVKGEEKREGKCLWNITPRICGYRVEKNFGE